MKPLHLRILFALCFVLAAALYAVQAQRGFHGAVEQYGFALACLACGLAAVFTSGGKLQTLDLIPKAMRLTGACPSCAAIVEFSLARHLQRLDERWYDFHERSLMRCVSCGTRFRRQERPYVVYSIAVILGGLLVGGLFGFGFRWLGSLVAVVGTIAAIHFLRLIPLERVSEEQAANERVLRKAEFRRQLRALAIALAPMMPMIVATVLNRFMRGWIDWPSAWVSLWGIAGSAILLALLGVALIVVGKQTIERRSWPILNPDVYPLRPLSEVSGKEAVWVGIGHLAMGTLILVAGVAVIIVLLILNLLSSSS